LVAGALSRRHVQERGFATNAALPFGGRGRRFAYRQLEELARRSFPADAAENIEIQAGRACDRGWNCRVRCVRSSDGTAIERVMLRPPEDDVILQAASAAGRPVARPGVLTPKATTFFQAIACAQDFTGFTPTRAAFALQIPVRVRRLRVVTPRKDGRGGHPTATRSRLHVWTVETDDGDCRRPHSSSASDGVYCRNFPGRSSAISAPPVSRQTEIGFFLGGLKIEG